MLRMSLFVIGLLCIALPLPVQAQEPPVANVENPPRDANAVIAFWTQIVPGQVDPRTPSVEARYILMMPQSTWSAERRVVGWSHTSESFLKKTFLLFINFCIFANYDWYSCSRARDLHSQVLPSL